MWITAEAIRVVQEYYHWHLIMGKSFILSRSNCSWNLATDISWALRKIPSSSCRYTCEYSHSLSLIIFLVCKRGLGKFWKLSCCKIFSAIMVKSLRCQIVFPKQYSSSLAPHQVCSILQSTMPIQVSRLFTEWAGIHGSYWILLSSHASQLQDGDNTEHTGLAKEVNKDELKSENWKGEVIY